MAMYKGFGAGTFESARPPAWARNGRMPSPSSQEAAVLIDDAAKATDGTYQGRFSLAGPCQIFNADPQYCAICNSPRRKNP